MLIPAGIANTIGNATSNGQVSDVNIATHANELDSLVKVKRTCCLFFLAEATSNFNHCASPLLMVAPLVQSNTRASSQPKPKP